MIGGVGGEDWVIVCWCFIGWGVVIYGDWFVIWFGCEYFKGGEKRCVLISLCMLCCLMGGLGFDVIILLFFMVLWVFCWFMVDFLLFVG